MRQTGQSAKQQQSGKDFRHLIRIFDGAKIGFFPSVPRKTSCPSGGPGVMTGSLQTGADDATMPDEAICYDNSITAAYCVLSVTGFSTAVPENHSPSRQCIPVCRDVASNVPTGPWTMRNVPRASGWQ